MAGSRVFVRSAGETDVVDLVALWGELKRCGALSPRLAALSDDAQIEARLRRLLVEPGATILVATMSGRVVGMAMLATTPLNAFNETPCVHIENTIVAEGFRRRGVGRALMASAARFAEDVGAEHITVGVSPMSREANRFYAQLGFTPLAVRRVAPASALRRRLAALDRSPSSRGSVARGRPAARTPVRTALRRIAAASSVVEAPHDV